MTPQSAEKRRKSRTSANGDYAKWRRIAVRSLLVRLRRTTADGDGLRWPTRLRARNQGMPAAVVPALRKFRIQQLREARVIHHALEVVVRPGLKSVLRIELDGLRQAVETILRLAGD